MSLKILVLNEEEAKAVDAAMLCFILSKPNDPRCSMARQVRNALELPDAVSSFNVITETAETLDELCLCGHDFAYHDGRDDCFAFDDDEGLVKCDCKRFEPARSSLQDA